MTSKQKEATQRIQENCAEYGKDLTEKDLDFSKFIVLEKYKLVYCSVPKVACTVWKRILANLEGYNITRGVHKKTKNKLKILSNYTTEDRSKILKTPTRSLCSSENLLNDFCQLTKIAFWESSSEGRTLGNVIVRG